MAVHRSMNDALPLRALQRTRAQKSQPLAPSPAFASSPSARSRSHHRVDVVHDLLPCDHERELGLLQSLWTLRSNPDCPLPSTSSLMPPPPLEHVSSSEAVPSVPIDPLHAALLVLGFHRLAGSAADDEGLPLAPSPAPAYPSAPLLPRKQHADRLIFI